MAGFKADIPPTLQNLSDLYRRHCYKSCVLRRLTVVLKWPTGKVSAHTSTMICVSAKSTQSRRMCSIVEAVSQQIVHNMPYFKSINEYRENNRPVTPGFCSSFRIIYICTLEFQSKLESVEVILIFLSHFSRKNCKVSLFSYKAILRRVRTYIEL